MYVPFEEWALYQWLCYMYDTFLGDAMVFLSIVLTDGIVGINVFLFHNGTTTWKYLKHSWHEDRSLYLIPVLNRVLYYSNGSLGHWPIDDIVLRLI